MATKQENRKSTSGRSREKVSHKARDGSEGLRTGTVVGRVTPLSPI